MPPNGSLLRRYPKGDVVPPPADPFPREAGGRRFAVRPRTEIYPPRCQAGEHAAGTTTGSAALDFGLAAKAHSSASLRSSRSATNALRSAPGATRRLKPIQSLWVSLFACVLPHPILAFTS